MDEYQHLRESADEETVLRQLDALGIGFGPVSHLRGSSIGVRHAGTLMVRPSDGLMTPSQVFLLIKARWQTRRIMQRWRVWGWW